MPSLCGIAYTWGTTADERIRALPCDELLPAEAMVADRAIDVAARPETLFRWLCQLQVAPYSYDWIDNLGRRSPQTLTRGLDELVSGQRFMTIFRLVSWEPGRQLTLASRGNRVFGDVAVTYDVGPGRLAASRLHVRVRWRTPRVPALRALAASGDLVMMRKQLRTLARLAEQDERSASSPGIPVADNPDAGAGRRSPLRSCRGHCERTAALTPS
jgi:hypothetical protein